MAKKMAFGKYVAPEGGWGWVIVLASALINMVMIPIMQGFGMIYGDTFKQLGISATQSTIIINVNQAFGMILGLMNGPLLRTYGYRKMSIIGCLLYSIGVILTSFASSFIHFIITYGMMSSLGMAIGMSANSLALNTYFKEKRGRAMGMTMTLTGLGPIFMPLLTSLLLSIYDSGGTMLILGGLSLNSLVGSLLFQPIKWHAKLVEPLEESLENEEDDIKPNTKCNKEESALLLTSSMGKSINNIENELKKSARHRSRLMTMSSADFNDDNISIYGFEMPISMQNGSLLDLRGTGAVEEDLNLKNEENKKFQHKFSTNNLDIDFKRSNSWNEPKTRKFSISSIKYGDLALTNKVLLECPEEDGELTKSINDVENGTEKPPINSTVEPEKNNSSSSIEKLKKPRSPLMRLFRRIVLFFDLDLLRDPIYVNIMLGMSIAIFAEFNFSVLTPFILVDMNLKTNQVAMMMSVLATSDLLLRALAPYIGEWVRKSTRVMYLVSLVLLILTRTALTFARSYFAILAVGVGLGIAKGIRTVYMTLVIPSYVPLERLPSASSIQSLVNGCILLVAGPFLGVIRDLTGSYMFCILFLNFVTAITIILWLTEFAILRIIKRRKLAADNSNQGIKKVESQ